MVVNLTGETADIVVPDTKVDDASRAQIEDIVKRKPVLRQKYCDHADEQPAGRRNTGKSVKGSACKLK